MGIIDMNLANIPKRPEEKKVFPAKYEDVTKIVDPALEYVKEALGAVRYQHAEEQLKGILTENISTYAKMFKLEYLIQSLSLGVTSSNGIPVTIGPSRISDHANRQTSFFPLTFAEEAWAAAAYKHVKTRNFFEQVLKMSQKVIEHANLANPPLLPGNNAATEQMGFVTAITELMAYITEDHYSLVALAGMTYAFLDAIFEKHQRAKKLLFLMSQIRTLVLQYNAHHPGSHPTIELGALYQMRNLLSVTDEALDYMTGAEFHAISTGKRVVPNTPSSDVGAEITLRNLDNLSGLETVASVGRVKLDRDDRKKLTRAVFRVHVVNPEINGQTSAAVRVIRAEEVRVDISPSRVVSEVLDEIAVNVNRVIEHTILECQEMLRVAQMANYNLGTGQWGSFLTLAENERHMRELEPLIFQQAQALQSTLLAPRFHFVTEYTTWFFPTRLSFTVVLMTQGVRPGETVKFRVTTGTSTKESQTQTQSIAESQSQEAQDDYQDELKKTAAESNTVNTDDQKYCDAAQSVATNRASDWGVYLDAAVGKGGAAKALGYSVEAGAEYNASESTDTSNEVSKGMSAQIQTERQMSNEVQSKALRKHCEKKAASRQTNIAVSTETSTETQRTESTEQEFTNPSKIAPMTVIHLALVQEFVAIRSVTGFYLDFINGLDYQRYPISAFNTVMAKYLEVSDPNVQRAIEAARRQVRRASIITDYRGRDVLALEETSLGNFKFRSDPYHLLLPQGLDEGDIDIALVKDRVSGVVIGTDPLKMPSPGFFTVCIMGPAVLDDNAQRMFEASLQSRDLENEFKSATIAQLEADITIRQQMVDFILKTKKVDDVAKFQRDSMFQLLKDSKEMWDKYQLISLFHHGDGSSRKLVKRLPFIDADDLFDGAGGK